MGVFEIIGSVFLALGCVFALTGSIGVLRMPDFYTRLHPAGKSDTLAQGLILIGLALIATQQLIGLVEADHGEGHGTPAWIGVANIILKLVLLSALLFLTAPTSTHAISKAARLDRHTRLSIDADDPGGSRVAEIVVVGDVEERLSEANKPVLDVHEDESEDASADPAADESGPADSADPGDTQTETEDD